MSEIASEAFAIPRRSALRGWLPEALFLVVTTAAGLWAGGRWLNPVADPGEWWSLIHRLNQGETLYRDVFLQYTPLSPYLLSLLTRLFGPSSGAFLILNWIPAILLGVLILRASRPYLTELERLVVVGLVITLGIFCVGKGLLVLPYSPAAVHALVFSTAALLYLQRRGPGRFDPYIAGGLAGLAFCCKQEIGVAAIAGLGAPVLTRGRRAASWLVPLLATFGVLCVLGFGIALRNSSFDSLRFDNHVWPVGTLPPEWKFLSQIAAGVRILGWPARVAGAAMALVYEIVLIGLFAMLFTGDTRVRRPLLLLLLGVLLVAGAWDGALTGKHVDPLCLSMIAAFALAGLALLNRKWPGREFVVGFGLFAGLVAARTAFACAIGLSSFSGVANVSTSLTWTLLLVCFLPKLFPGENPAGRLTRRLWTFVLLSAAIYGAFLGIRALRGNSLVAAVETSRGRVWVPRQMAPFFAELAQNLKEGERVLVLPEAKGLDALFGLRSASPLISHLPPWLDERAERKILERVAKVPPDAVVLFHRETWEFGVEPFGVGYGKNLARWIARNYRVVVRNPSGLVLRRQPGAADQP